MGGQMARRQVTIPQIDPGPAGEASGGEWFMAKMIAFDQEAQEKIRAGVSKLAKAVRVTLGPRGRNVILQKSFGSPTVTKDGVTVAREFSLGLPGRTQSSSP